MKLRGLLPCCLVLLVAAMAQAQAPAAQQIDPQLDRPAFDPAVTIPQPGHDAQARLRDGKYELLTRGFGGGVEPLCAR